MMKQKTYEQLLTEALAIGRSIKEASALVAERRFSEAESLLRTEFDAIGVDLSDGFPTEWDSLDDDETFPASGDRIH